MLQFVHTSFLFFERFLVMSNENVEVVEVVAEVKARRANVADKDIISAWQKMAVRKDENGEKNGSIKEVADGLGMLKASLVQRVTSLKKLGVPLSDMPREKTTGKKKNLAELQALLAQTNQEIEASVQTTLPEILEEIVQTTV